LPEYFFRNSINIGLPIFESEEAVEGISDGDNVKVDINTNTITNLTTNKEYSFTPFADEMKDIIKARGLMEYIKVNYCSS